MPVAEVPGASARDVRQLLAARTGAAIESARRTGGEVPQAELDALNRLARLLELEDASAERRPNRAWELAAILVATLIVVSALLFAHVDRTEVELEIDATRVSFKTDSEQVLFEEVDLSALGVSGLSRITLPDAAVAAFGGSVLDAPEQAIRLSVAEIDGRRGALGISELKPTKPTSVDVRLRGRNGEYRLSFQDPGMTIAVGAIGPIKITIAGVGERTIDLPIPQNVTLEPAGGSVDLDATFRDLEQAAMTPQVPVSALAFSRVDEFGDRSISVLRTVSTILGGTVYFEELNEERRALRAGEALRFEQIQDAEIRTLRMRGDRLSVGFHGTVRGMSTGDSQRGRTLMPTWLDWLKAQHGLSLLWGTTLYVVGLLVAALRWFRGAQ
jgi:urease beta subunit